MVGSSFEVSNQLEYNIAGSFFLSEDIHYMNLATVKDVKNIYTVVGMKLWLAFSDVLCTVGKVVTP